MKLPKRLHRLISFFLSLTLVFQTFSPAIIYAQEATQSADIQTETVTPTPSETPAVTPTEEITPTPTEIPTPEVTPELTPVPTPEPTSGSDPVVPLWIQIDGDTVTTNENVGEGTDYRFRDTNLIVRFTKVTKPGKLTIREVKLTPEQIASSGALSDTAYDITSDMENGSFLYDLTLPLPQDNQNAKVEFASDQNSLDQSVAIDTNVTKTPDTIEIKGLDHFTIFFVSGGKDQATDGNGCNNIQSHPCNFNTSEKQSLKQVDGNKLAITDYLPNPDEPGFWPETTYASDRYLEFEFQNLDSSIDTIDNAYLKVVYETSPIDSGEPYDAKLQIKGSSWLELPNFIGPDLSSGNQTYLIQLPASYNNRGKLNGLKARFSMFGSPADESAGVSASFDQVVLLVNYSTPTVVFDPIQNPTNDDTPTITGTATAYGGATVKNVEYRTDGGSWMPALPTDGTFDESSEPFGFTPDALSEGEHLFEARAIDSYDTIQTEMISLSLTTDYTGPSANLIFPVPGPAATGFRVVFSEAVTPSEATNPANYFLDNWPGVGGSGDLFGDANITYDADSHTATVSFISPFWYISPEQNWGVKSIHDLAGNQLPDTWGYSTPMVAPSAPGTPLTPTPTNSLSQLWGWTAATDPGGVNASGIKGYWYSVTGPTPISWIFLSGNVLSATTSLGEGVSEFSVKAEDNAGNQGDVSTGGVTVDRTGPPAPTITFPGAEQYFRTSPISNRWTAVADSSGIKEYRVEYQYDDGHTFSNAPYRSTASTWRNHLPNSNEQGGVRIRVQALDNAGNYGSWSDWVHYYYDATAPTLVSKTTFSGWYGEDQVSEFTYTDANGVVSGTPVSCTISTEGSNQTCSVTPNVCDAAGNCNTTPVTSNDVNIDKSAPVVDAGPDRLVKEIFTQEGSGSDVISGIASYSWSKNSGEGNVTFGSPDESITTVSADQDGVYEISLTATDNAGNFTSDTFTLTWDATSPTANITSPANGSYKKSKPTFDVSASDDNGVASVKFQYRLSGVADFTDLNTDTVPSPYRAKWVGVTLTTNNVYDLRAIATDTLGNLSMTPIVSFTFDNQLPEILYSNPLGGETVWYNSSPLFNIDFLYDDDGAPLDKAQYRLDGGSFKNIFTVDRTSDYTTDWGIASWATLAEGLHQLDIKLIDKAGNTNTDNYVEGISGLNVGKDLTAPVVTVPENKILEAEGSEGAPYVFSPAPSVSDDSGTSGVTCDYASGETFPIGITTVTCNATDPAGNTGSASFDITVNDTTGPELSLPDDITAEATGADGAIVIYEASANDLVDGPVEISCSPESGSTFSLGTTTVDCEATDSNDNTTSGSFEVTVEDNIKPTSIITVPGNNGTNSLIYSNSWDGSILGTAADGESGLARVDLSIQRNSDGKYFDGESWIEAGEDEPRVTADGTADWNYILASPAEDSYEITSHAVDNAGNVEDSYKLTIVFDKTIPEVTIVLDPAVPDSGNNWYQTEPTITLTATDNTVTDHIEYQWDSTAGIWTVYALPMKTPGEGSHTLYYRAYDKAGNVSDTGIKNIKYDKTELTDGPLNISVSPNPTSGTTAKVKWDAASDNVGIEKYEINWSLDGTSTSYTDTVGNEVREHEINKLDQEGKWNITVTAFDAAGNRKSGSTELTVDRGAPATPTLTLGGTGVGTATLTWNKVTDANDYIIWYGNTSGTYLFGARTGDVDNFTVRGLGGGDYYFVIQSVDNAGNRSGNSNEVSTLALAGTPGVEPGTPAEGFTPEVKGETTTETPTVSVSPTPEVLGETNNNNFPWWLILLLIATGGYASWRFLRRND